jgi:phosphoglycolate phosphatase-like HAD superfamily hydrolase
MLPDKDIVIFDLDGTLALIEHRVHYITGEKPDWTAFYAACAHDFPNSPIITVYRALARQGYELWIVSGRSDEVIEQTTEWLKHHVGDYHKLIMRKAGDHQPDNKLKRSWVKDGTIPQERVLVIFEDRASVVKMWRELGFTCLQVAPGEF